MWVLLLVRGLNYGLAVAFAVQNSSWSKFNFLIEINYKIYSEESMCMYFSMKGNACEWKIKECISHEFPWNAKCKICTWFYFIVLLPKSGSHSLSAVAVCGRKSCPRSRSTMNQALSMIHLLLFFFRKALFILILTGGRGNKNRFWQGIRGLNTYYVLTGGSSRTPHPQADRPCTPMIKP